MNKEFYTLDNNNPYICWINLACMAILVALDRDGTINRDVGFLGRYDDWKEKVVIYPHVSYAIKNLKSAGFNPDGCRIIVASNQAGVARGFFNEARIKEVNQEIDSRLRQEGAVIDGWYFSVKIQSEYAKKYSIPLDSIYVDDKDTTRKPGIGMLEQAARDFNLTLKGFERVYVVGDKAVDVQTGLNAAGVGILFKNGNNQEEVDKTKELARATRYWDRVFFVNDFSQVAALIC